MAIRKSILILLLALELMSCGSEKFNLVESDKLVKLDSESLENFNELNKLLLRDLKEIRETSTSLTSGDTSYLSTNSYYLYKIDRDSYFPIIEKLKRKKVFIDRINTTVNGTLFYSLKINTDNSTLPNIQYTHELVWDINSNFLSPPYSRIIEVKKDSSLGNGWRYIYFLTNVGH